MTMSFANDIEQSFRDGLREVNYNFKVTYGEMAANSGFNENTLKSFVNNEGVRLPDERDTLYNMLRLSRWLSHEKDCDVISQLFCGNTKHICENGATTVDGDLGNEIRGISETNGKLSIADRNNNIPKLKEIAKKLGKLHSAVNAEIAIKENG